ncbi:MAG: MarR family transcriptional regulator [Comamonadaceae bacterium]|nr:MAG: MarR family transcriptional regulator [Comamonadaceae bacterium]
MSSDGNAVRKPHRSTTKGAAGASPARTMVGHGGVIDLHAYAAPLNLRTSHMEEYFGYLVRRLDNKIHASFLRALADEEITPARFTALSIIGANPGLRQVDIARALEIARPAALKLVNQLVDLGLVDTHPIPSDKRIGALALSAKGQAKLADYEKAVRDHETAICSRISAAERERLTQLLRKLLDL